MTLRNLSLTILLACFFACGGSATDSDETAAESAQGESATVGSETALAEAPNAEPSPPGDTSSVIGEELTYEADGKTLKGYLAYNTETDQPRPGILVVHEWWGHNEYVRERARMLAELGYTALALDMYGEGKNTEHPKEAGEFSAQALKDLKGARARFEAAAELLRDHKTTDADLIGAIGYCFGGGVALNMARMGSDLDAVVSFHGSLDPKKKAKKGAIKAEILVLTGEADPMVPAKSVEAFKKEMKQAKADVEVVSYPGVVHAFTNPDATELGKKYDLPIKYDAQADKDSWERMKAHLAETFAEEADEAEEAADAVED